MKNGLVSVLVALISTINADELNFENIEQQQNAAANNVVVQARAQTISDSLLVELKLVMGKNIHIYSSESLFFEITTVKSNGLKQLHIQRPEPKIYRNFDGSKVNVYTNGQKFQLIYNIVNTSWNLVGYIKFQACDEFKCFLPVKKKIVFSSDAFDSSAVVLQDYTDEVEPLVLDGTNWKELAKFFEVRAKAGGFIRADKFVEFLQSSTNKGTSDANAFIGKSIWVIVALVVFGGMALNLTPCVLPMIPITLAILGAGTRAGSRQRGFMLGLMYGLAMAFTYGVVGIVVVLGGARFGQINASPIFNILIAIIFVILALGMFDIIHIDFTRYRSGVRYDQKNKSSLVVAFFMGIVAALLAGACVAPVVISTVLYAASLYGSGNRVAILLPLLLGIGMALPWPFAGAGLSFLPKPGKWMNWVRTLFGIIIMCIALYYGWTGVMIIKDSTIPHAGELVRYEQDQNILWEYSLENGLRRAVAENKYVLIDFWASWCKNCIAMDAITFKDKKVQEKLTDFVIIKFKAENPKEASTKEVLDHFDIVGLPAFIVMKKK